MVARGSSNCVVQTHLETLPQRNRKLVFRTEVTLVKMNRMQTPTLWVTELHLVVWAGPGPGGMGHLLCVREPGVAPSFCDPEGRAALNLCIQVFLFAGQITQTEKAGWEGECVFTCERRDQSFSWGRCALCAAPRWREAAEALVRPAGDAAVASGWLWGVSAHLSSVLLGAVIGAHSRLCLPRLGEPPVQVCLSRPFFLKILRALLYASASGRKHLRL